MTTEQVIFVVLGLVLILGAGFVGRRLFQRREGLAGEIGAGVASLASVVLALVFALDRLAIASWHMSAAWLGDALDYEIFDLGGSPVTPTGVVIILLVLLLAYKASGTVQERLAARLRQQGLSDEATTGASTRVAHYVVMAIGLAVGLQAAGINLSAMFAAGAVFAIGIGFAVQTLMQNFVAGLLLLVEGAIRPGDVLLVNGKIVKVREMRIRTTVVTSEDRSSRILPNSMLVTDAVENLSMGDRYHRVRVMVGVSYGADPNTVRDALFDVGTDFMGPTDAGEPIVLLRDFGSSSVDFELSIFTGDPFRAVRTSSELRMAIWYKLKEIDVEIAFPQVDVHFDPDVLKLSA